MGIEKYNLPPLDTVEQLNQIALRITEMNDPAALAELKARSVLAQEYAKQKELSEEIATKASKLAIASCLRICELGLDHLEHINPKTHRGYFKNIATHFGIDQAWELLATYDEPVSVSKFYTETVNLRLGQKLEQEREEARKKAWEVAMGRADGINSIEGKEAVAEHLSQEKGKSAIAGLLEEAARSGEPFSVNEITDSLLDSLGSGWDEDQVEDVTNTLQRLNGFDLKPGMREMVRHAIRQAAVTEEDKDVWPIEANGREVFPPAYVTFESDDFGWLRIPWNSARMSHLKDMLALREAQAIQARDAADDLRVVYEACGGDKAPGDGSAPHRYRNALKGRRDAA